MKAIVDGVERYSLFFRPNGLRCDACPTQVNFGRDEFRHNEHIRAYFRTVGWLCSDETTNTDLCPACARALLDQL